MTSTCSGLMGPTRSVGPRLHNTDRLAVLRELGCRGTTSWRPAHSEVQACLPAIFVRPPLGSIVDGEEHMLCNCVSIRFSTSREEANLPFLAVPTGIRHVRVVPLRQGRLALLQRQHAGYITVALSYAKLIESLGRMCRAARGSVHFNGLYRRSSAVNLWHWRRRLCPW